jgi:transcriptional regulator with XRE-family HTH domain
MTIGDKIRTLRKDRGWTQEELAKKLGVKPQNISRYEKGRVQPRESTLAIFAEIFALPLAEFTNLAASVDIPNLDPEIAEYVRAIPTLDAKDQEAVKCVLKALVTAKKAQNLFAL